MLRQRGSTVAMSSSFGVGGGLLSRSRVLLCPPSQSPVPPPLQNEVRGRDYDRNQERPAISSHGRSSAPTPGEGGRVASRPNPALDSSFVKCLQREIEDEDLRIDKEEPSVLPGWKLHHDEGTSFFILSRSWTTNEGLNETHTVRVQLTARDTSLDPEFDIRGEHFPFTVIIRNDRSDNVVDLSCDVIESEFVVDNLRCYHSSLLATELSPAAQLDRDLLYPGPPLDQTEEDVLDGLQAWLAEREFDDRFAEFVAQYSAWIEQLEYERWLKEFKSFLLA